MRKVQASDPKSGSSELCPATVLSVGVKSLTLAKTKTLPLLEPLEMPWNKLTISETTNLPEQIPCCGQPAKIIVEVVRFENSASSIAQ